MTLYEDWSAVSINLDSQNLSKTGPRTRQHTPADMRSPTYIQQRTAGSGSIRDDAPNPQETGGPREFRGHVGWGWGHPHGDGVGWGGGVGCGAVGEWMGGREWNIECKK